MNLASEEHLEDTPTPDTSRPKKTVGSATPKTKKRTLFRRVAVWGLAGMAAVLLLISGLLVTAWAISPSADELMKQAASRSKATRFLDQYGEPLYTVYADKHQLGVEVPLDSLPPSFVEYLLFAEDRSFYSNPGVSFKGLSRVIAKRVPVVKRMFGGSSPGGASTITMQLVKAITGRSEQTYARKLAEIGAAMKLTARLSKRQILELYVNNAAFGMQEHYGINYAAHKFFSKVPSELTQAEGLLLVAQLPGHSRRKDLENLTAYYHQRREQLFEHERMSTRTYAETSELPKYRRGKFSAFPHGTFIDQALRETGHLLRGSGYSMRDGLVVTTTLGSARNAAVARKLSTATPEGGKSAFGLLNRQGKVRAYTSLGPSQRGHLDLLYSESRKTPPASKFKPFLYGLLIDDLLKKGMSPREIFSYEVPKRCEVPKAVFGGKQDYVVTDGNGKGTIPLRKALAVSENSPACWIFNHRLGRAYVNRKLARIGLGPEHLPYPSSALGTEGMRELQLAALYRAITVGGGVYMPPRFVEEIRAANGEILYDADQQLPRRTSLISAQASRVLMQGLRYVTKEGTTRKIDDSPLLEMRDIGAKTGTATSHRGVTGVMDSDVFTLTVEGKGLGFASTVAVPIARGALMCFAEPAPRC